MTPTPEEHQAFAESMQRLIAAHPSLRIDLDWGSTVALIAGLQLSLRHPANTGLPAQRCRRFVDTLIAQIAAVEPVLAELLRAGDNPEHDARVEPRAIPALVSALEESVELQSLYAQILNGYDGGKRMVFADAQAWLDRLAEVERLPTRLVLA